MAKQMNNNQARKKLIEENLPLVPFVVRRYFPNSGYEKEELIAVGSIGLIKSIDSFDASKG